MPGHEPCSCASSASAAIGRRLGLVALLLAFAALSALYAEVTPPAEGPDAAAHLRFVAWFQNGWRRPELSEANARRSHQIVSQPPLYHALAAAWLGDVRADGTRLEATNPQWPGDSPRLSVTPPDATRADALPWRLAALVSCWGGLLAVVATWGLVRTLLPASAGLALAAAAVAGLNPQFLFSAATVGNDTWVAAASALAVWLAARAALRRPDRPAAWLAAGLALGAAALAKYSGLTAAFPIGALLLLLATRRGIRSSLRAAAWTGLGAVLVAGWWYADNLLRWGEVVPAGRLAEILPHLSRATPQSWAWAVERLPWLYRSYWGVYGHGVVPTTPYQRLTDALVALAVAGLMLLAIRLARSPRPDPTLPLAALGATWASATTLALLAFVRTARFGIHGRLALPAAGAIAALLVLGWWSLAPARLRSRLAPVLVLSYAGLALWQGLYLRAAYALPRPVPVTTATDRPLAARFGGGVEVLGIDLPAGNVAYGGTDFPVRLTLGATQPVTGFARAFVHLSDVDDNAFGRWDGAPAGGRHVTAQWRPGEAFQDTVTLAVPPVAAGRVVTLSLGFYDPDTRERWPLLGAEGRPVADRALAGHVWVQPGPSSLPPAHDAGLAAWANGVVLVSAAVETDPTGMPRLVRARWSTQRPLHRDLTVFAQVLDRSGRLLAQADRRPQGGGWPTDAWPPGVSVPDVYRLQGPSGDWGSVIVGLYDSQGVRLRLADESADHALIGKRQGTPPVPVPQPGRPSTAR